MIKRSLSFLLVLTMMLAVFSILPVSAAQADEDISTIGLSGKTIDFSGGKLSYESTNGHIVITGSENLSSEITIPDSIEGLPVTVIGSNAFKDQTEITSVVISEDVTEIGTEAFMNCPQVKSVKIPSTVSVIGDKAFGYTTQENKVGNFTIEGFKNSAADNYASYNGFAFTDITPVTYPVITGFENTEDGVRITWDKCDGADFYRIYYKDGNHWERLASKYLTEYVDTNIKNGETRIYTIRCLDENEDFVSDFNREGWSNTFYAAPKITSVSASGNSNIIRWDKVDGVAGYRLYRKELNGSWSRLFDATTDTSYTDTTAKSGVIYAYTLRLLDDEGNTVSDYIANVRHYRNGVKLNGNISYDGTYGFKDGYQLKGLNRVNGLLRYYNSEGRMYRDTIQNTSSGYYYIDDDGICIESKEIRLAAEYMAKYCKGDTLQEKMKSGFLYMAKNYPYVRVYNDTPGDEDDVPPFAIELFEYKAGTCYRYAAGFACLARIAGYRSRFCFSYSGTLSHGWTEVYVGGRWLNCDPDAQLPGYGFPDYYPYMTEYHIWNVDKVWYTELSFDDGEAVWGRKTYY